MSVGDTLLDSQVEKPVGTLDVSSRTKTDGSDCTSCLSVCWARLLMRLGIASELELAMLIVVM